MSWRNARPNRGLLWPHSRKIKSHLLVKFTLKNDGYHIMCGMTADLTTDVADGSGENPEDQHVMRQLEAGKRMLTEVRRVKNNLQVILKLLTFMHNSNRVHFPDSAEKRPSRLHTQLMYFNWVK